MAEADRINEIRERAERATPGPWRAGLGELRPHLDYATTDIVTGWTRESQHGMGTLAGACIVTGGEWDNEADVEFIAHAREDIACLLALLETTGRSLEEWKRTAVLAANDAARLRGRPPTDEEVWELPGPGESQERDAAAYASDRGTFSNHRGTLDSFPPYVGGDDDTIDEWQAECMCGWRGVKTDSVTRAHMDLIAHLNGALRGTPQTAQPSPSDVAPDVVPGVLCVPSEANEPPESGGSQGADAPQAGAGSTRKGDLPGGSLASEAQRERAERAMTALRDEYAVTTSGPTRAILEEGARTIYVLLARLVDAPPPESSRPYREVFDEIDREEAEAGGAASAAASGTESATPTEKRLACGCHAKGGVITAVAFLCDKNHKQGQHLTASNALLVSVRVAELAALQLVAQAAERVGGCIQHKREASAICPVCGSIRDDLRAALAAWRGTTATENPSPSAPSPAVVRADKP